MVLGQGFTERDFSRSPEVSPMEKVFSMFGPRSDANPRVPLKADVQNVSAGRKLNRLGGAWHGSFLFFWRTWGELFFFSFSGGPCRFLGTQQQPSVFGRLETSRLVDLQSKVQEDGKAAVEARGETRGSRCGRFGGGCPSKGVVLKGRQEGP